MRWILLPLLMIGSLAAASAAPRALQGVEPGLWAVSRTADGANARRLCLRQVVTLTAYEHRGEPCRPQIVSDRPGVIEVYNQCRGGDFARSVLSVTTPRSLKLETQGLHHGTPFEYRLYARRVGACTPNRAKR